MSELLYLDTNVFIKGVEANDAEAEFAWAILQAIASSQMFGVTSELTLAEVLPKPLASGLDELVDAYQAALNTGAGLTVAGVTREILLKAAKIRARHPQTRLPDAIHLATALDQGCTAFLSNDRRIRSPGELQVIRLSATTFDDLRTLTA